MIDDDDEDELDEELIEAVRVAHEALMASNPGIPKHHRTDGERGSSQQRAAKRERNEEERELERD